MTSTEAASAAPVTPILSKRPATKLMYAGIDDGHYGIKIVLEDGSSFNMPSRAAYGIHQVIAFDGDDSQDSTYAIDQTDITVLEDYALVPAQDTRFMTKPSYAVSPLNRALVNHGLLRVAKRNNIDLDKVTFAIVTGLPVGQFYTAGRKDDLLIDAKIKNLLKAPISNKNHSVKLPRIESHNVISEGIAAYFDLLFDMNGVEQEATLAMVRDRALAIVDVGGKTTDIAMVSEGGRGLYPERSGTKDFGVLQVNDYVAAGLQQRFKLSSAPPAKHVEAAIQSKTYRLSGDTHDISDLVQEALDKLAILVQSEINKLIGDGHDLGHVAFVGGGTILLKKHFAHLYPNQSIFPEQPEFANARGMLKAAKYLYSDDE
jgi:plasmid segregation protein ParM